MENLDFNVQYSGITEINDVISALDKMKEELSDSLKKQWKIEEARKSQISALAHDIKTPLTIIKGNSELLNELDLTEAQKEFNDSILKESGNIEFYIKLLIDINKSQQSQSIVKESINSYEFINDIIKQGEFLCLNKNVKFASDVKEVSETFNGDISCVKRAVMNVLSNAVQYTPKRGRILFSVYNDDKYMHFIIEDSGRGFSKEELTMATEEFYQGDKSRNSRDHYGMGLYIAQTFVNKHGGIINLSNSEYLGGARVELTILK
ncbi:MAG: HAMP domain-containing sensor histidine kinase [Inconstantimicrobium porci]|nr:HAMP domain-containing sensor histidine kinase [Inconstantimicrobium porci]MDY5913558.1 HAMP domain-containing sensor histidine kinase [Inconstantimicrobium porci]